MGQKASQQLALKDGNEVVESEVVSGAIVHAAQKLKQYLGFQYPQSTLCPATGTLNEIFLIHFIAFCQEKGVDEWLTTTKMTRHQALLFGADWIWTFWGPDKHIRLQLAVQTLQMASVPPRDPQACESRVEESSKRSRFDKLKEFCTLIGEDCLGLFVIFGVPGEPKAVRAVVLDSVLSKPVKSQLLGYQVVEQFVLPTRLELCSLHAPCSHPPHCSVPPRFHRTCSPGVDRQCWHYCAFLMLDALVFIKCRKESQLKKTLKMSRQF